MRMYPLGVVVILFISCKNAGGGKTQRKDTTLTAGSRDTQLVGSRDSQVSESRDTLPAPRVRATLSASEVDTTPPQAIKMAKRRAGPLLDTILRIIIDDVNLEGSGVKAKYIRDTLRSAQWEIIGESFQAQVTYTFPWDRTVHVKERESKYKVRPEDVRSDKDLATDSSSYLMDTTGVLLSKRTANFDDEGTKYMFTVFKKNVPMILKP